VRGSKVVPDGSVLDRSAEFIFAKPKVIQTLYECDRLGYLDAIGKLVQNIATSNVILGVKGGGVVQETFRLKAKLEAHGHFEDSNFFSTWTDPQREAQTYKWLEENWRRINQELEVPNSKVSIAVSGLLKREFLRERVFTDTNWKTPWYLPVEFSRKLSDRVHKRLLGEIFGLVRAYRVNWPVTEAELWVPKVVTAHYQNFGKYWLHFAENDGQYIPAVTRSSLKFLYTPTPSGSIHETALPFIGLEATKKVKRRGELIERVTDWSSREGKEIMDGLRLLQDANLMMEDSRRQEQQIKEAKRILRSSSPRWAVIAQSVVRLGLGFLRRTVDTKSDAKLAFNPSYRCLWRIRNPRLEVTWQKRIEGLL
jgi:hypothetical protein